MSLFAAANVQGQLLAREHPRYSAQTPSALAVDGSNGVDTVRATFGVQYHDPWCCVPALLFWLAMSAMFGWFFGIGVGLNEQYRTYTLIFFVSAGLVLFVGHFLYLLLPHRVNGLAFDKRAGVMRVSFRHPFAPWRTREAAVPFGELGGVHEVPHLESEVSGRRALVLAYKNMDFATGVPVGRPADGQKEAWEDYVAALKAPLRGRPVGVSAAETVETEESV